MVVVWHAIYPHMGMDGNDDIWDGPWLVYWHILPIAYKVLCNHHGVGSKVCIHVTDMKPYLTDDPI